jgi:hypothetical protein
LCSRGWWFHCSSLDYISSQFKEELREEIQIYPGEAENEEDVERKRAHKYSQDSKRK